MQSITRVLYMCRQSWHNDQLVIDNRYAFLRYTETAAVGLVNQDAHNAVLVEPQCQV